MLIREKDRALMEAVGEREKVVVMVMGKMRDTGRMMVKDSKTGESLEVARKVTFNPAIRARTVTVEGDVFEPSGIVEGGSRRRGVPVLSLLAKANKVRGELDAKERELDASSRELNEMCKRAEKYRSAKSALELALHNLEVLEKAEGVEEVVLVYAGCPDTSLTVTPDIKHAGRSSLVLVDLSGGHTRLGGSVLVQTFKQLGDVTPDCDTALLKRAFRATQRLLRERVLLAGHDRSDGGLLTTVLEMCFGGDCGCVMEATTENSVMEWLTFHDHLRDIPLLLTVVLLSISSMS